uniref:Uncharacterized protein n=1 Tax=Rhizophora mucronata TaxID=61149 RepID=A0A2P2P0S6_RHIMU
MPVTPICMCLLVQMCVRSCTTIMTIVVSFTYFAFLFHDSQVL